MWTMNFRFTIIIIVLYISCIAGQRVAPGVPPQQYQHVPVHQQPNANIQHHQQQVYQQQPQGHLPPGVAPQQYQQYQQVPVQNQQIPVHSQQVPVQHAPPQQVHQGQVHQQTGHHAPHGHHGQQQVLHTGNIREERAHIQEHMQVPIDTSKMSEAELQFHYFKMHDSDNNNKLDGCELIKSLIHWHEQEGKEKQTENTKLFTDEEFVALIDPILQNDDLSKDGFIDYPEYMKAQQKAAAAHQKQQQQQQQVQQQQAQQQQQGNH